MAFLGEWAGGVIGGTWALGEEMRMNAGTDFISFEEDSGNLNAEGRELGHRPSSAILSAHVPIRSYHLLVLNTRLLEATTFTSPAHIFKRLVVLANIRDAATMPTPLRLRR